MIGLRPAAGALLVAMVVALVPACGGDDGDAPAPTTAPSVEGGCTDGGTMIRVVAEDVDFDTDCITVPADTAFTIELENRDAGTRHNIVIRRGMEENLFEGEVFEGPDSRSYQVDAIPAGEYRFFCMVHPFEMLGDLTAG